MDNLKDLFEHIIQLSETDEELSSQDAIDEMIQHFQK